MVEESIAKPRGKKKLIIALSALGVLIIGLVVAIVTVVLINNENNRYKPTLVDEENEGLEKIAEIARKSRTLENYVASDAIRDYENAIRGCKTAGCRVYVKIGYANYLQELYEELDRPLSVMSDAENDLGESSDTVKRSYYLAMKDFMTYAGNEAEAEYYGGLADQYLLK